MNDLWKGYWIVVILHTLTSLAVAGMVGLDLWSIFFILVIGWVPVTVVIGLVDNDE